MNHLIANNGQEMDITEGQAHRLLALDLIYHCPNCDKEWATQTDAPHTIYHLTKTADSEVQEEAHWREIEAALNGPDADTPMTVHP